jgi:maltooligosyltrehalose trehalohydrolase
MTSTAQYRVWAPNAERLALQVHDGRLPMRRTDGGWWTADRPMRHGELYGYFIDDEGPFPDPRSRFQPSGVHGLSMCIDHGLFEWTDHRWEPSPLAAAVIYELHVGTFSEAATFEGVVSRLSHLVALGVTHLELMPVAEFSGARGWGYDGVDLFAPHHHYGRPEDLKRLVDACHATGLAVILDVVYNHFGPAGNYVSRFGPYVTDRYKTPWGGAVNLDGPGSDEVRRFICDNALMWLRDYHFDGLRIDAIHALLDTSATHLLEQLACEVGHLEASIGRHLVLIAESDLNDPRIIRSRESGGYGIDAQWSDDFHHALHTVLTGERSGYYEDFGALTHLAAAIQEVFVYAGTYSRFRNRVHGRSPHDLPGSRFVVAAQNHDQVGNRATGDRLVHLTSPGRLKIAAALLLTSPFIPLLFQGEEWGASTPFQYFTAHEDEGLGVRVREGRRQEFAPFGWDPAIIPDPQAVETYDRSRLRWNEPDEQANAALLDWYRSLIRLRREYPALRDGDRRHCRVTWSDEEEWIVVHRRDIAIACNLGSQSRTVDATGARRVLLASEPAITVRDHVVTLPPDGVAVLT